MERADVGEALGAPVEHLKFLRGHDTFTHELSGHHL